MPVDLKKLPAVHIVGDASGLSVDDLPISSFVQDFSNNAVDDMQSGIASCSRQEKNLANEKVFPATLRFFIRSFISCCKYFIDLMFGKKKRKKRKNSVV